MPEKITERKAERHRIQADLSKLLFIGEAHHASRRIGVDVSRDGLSVLGFEALEVNATATLEINGKSIKLVVVWTKSDTVRQGIFHADLTAASGSPDLVEEFKKAGLLVEKPVMRRFEFRAIGKKGE